MESSQDTVLDRLSGMATISRLPKNDRSLLQKSPIKETYILQKRRIFIVSTQDTVLDRAYGMAMMCYGMAMIRRLLKNIRLFCRT